MDKEFEKGLERYFIKNGIREVPANNKEKLKLLKEIVFKTKVEIDFTDLVHESNKQKGLADKDYTDKINNLEINSNIGSYYISNVKGIVREERKLELKAKIMKALKIR